jgi:PKD domain.
VGSVVAIVGIVTTGAVAPAVASSLPVVNAVTTYSGGYTLDGFGGIHPFGVGTGTQPAATSGGAYWNGWDIARGVALLPNRKGGYVVDAYGGIHPFATGANAMPAALLGTPYWNGQDMARGITIASDGRGGYVVDRTGALRPFTIGAGRTAPLSGNGVFAATTVAVQGVALIDDGTDGFTVDGTGGLHRFGVGANARPPAAVGAAAWTGWDIARDVALMPAAVDPIHAALSISPASGVRPFAVVADASASTDGDATPIATYRFDFGDGTTVGPQAKPTASHTYTVAGNYTVWISAGQTLVLTQRAFQDFDTSDTSTAGCYGCDPTLCSTAVSPTVPVINITVGGIISRYYDRGQVLNTRGVDAAGCPYTATRNDESEAWTAVPGPG